MLLNTHISTYFDISLFSITNKLDTAPDHYQFIMVYSGTIVIETTENKHTLKANDFILLQPGKKYQVVSLSDNFLLSVLIGRSFIDSRIEAGKSVICHSAIQSSASQTMQSILTKLVIAYHTRNSEANLYANLFRLVDCIRKNYAFDIELPIKDKAQEHHIKRKMEISNYLQINYHLSLTLQNLADHMYLSPQYLSKFIRHHFGQTFFKYLTSIRMEHALIELTQTDHLITTISFNNGFPNINAFNKAFKEFYDTTPTIFRQKEDHLKAERAREIENSIVKQNYAAAMDYLSLVNPFNIEQESVKTPSLTHTLLPNGLNYSLSHIWTELINLGPAENVLSQSFQEIFKEAQAKLKFRYARLENILDEILFFKIPESEAYNFTNIDMIFDFFEECDIIPFIELSNKPKKTSLSTHVSGFILADAPIDRPDEDYLNDLGAILKHVINRYGILKVSKWKFELWARHEKELLYTETPIKYVKRFKAFYTLIKQYLPDALVGGPGYNSTSHLEFFQGFLEEFERKKFYPDFISIYLFAYEMSEPSVERGSKHANDVAVLSPNPNRFEYCILECKKISDKILSVNRPLYVTEFNSDITANNFINYSSFQATFICKNNIDLLNHVSCVGYYLLSSFSGFPHISKQESLTGIGLIGVHDIRNPAYFAYEFLSRMGNKLVSKGDHYLVTTSSNDTYQILAYNYTHFNTLFCVNFFDRMGIEDTYEIFEEKSSIHLNFELEPSQKGWYKIAKYVLNREYGSVIDKYLEVLEDMTASTNQLMYLIVNLQAEEAKYYQNTCVPKQMITYQNCKNRLVLTLELEPHEVNFIEISRRI